MSDPATCQRYAEVALALPLPAYTYVVPSSLVGDVIPGALVEAPLSNRTEIGCVLAVSDEPGTLDVERLRPISRRVSPEYAVGAELMQLARFVADYYLCSLGEFLATVSAVGFNDVHTQRHPVYRLSANWRTLTAGRITARQQAACEQLESAGFPAGSRAFLAENALCSAAIISKLESLGLLEEQPLIVMPTAAPERGASHPPMSDQQDALDAIMPAVRAPHFQVFLLHGVTGSGKTEVYLQAMEETLAAGRTALCLVPEISLTPQTVARFEERFRQEIGVFHSQLTRSQKLLLHRKIEAGAIRIVIGARSAVFAGLPNLGLVVLDEEHDGSYKQGETPRYHARDVAIVRAQRLGIPVILGSATPSLESYHNAQSGKFVLLRLGTRAAGAQLPDVRVIDLAREAAESASHSLFSPALVAEIRKRLARKEQTILFLNRRGFSNFLFCPSCKWVARCDDDDVALTVHKRGGTARSEGEDIALDLFEPDKAVEVSLRCHFCGSKHPAPKICPSCAGDGLMTVGSGTQRVERELAELFPDARILRMDHDTAGSRDTFMAGWKQMVSGEADIILGTQMIAKGLHLESVTLVGVVLADVGLFLPDFRAEERTFALLTQVAGRTGRVSPGEVIFQTYMPTHTAIRHATRHDYEGFFEEELKRRRQLGFPPFTRLVAITVSDEDRERAFKSAKLLAHMILRRRYGPGTDDITISGPTIAPISRLAGRFRYRILLRGKNSRSMTRLLAAALEDPDLQQPGSTRTTIDVDPNDLL